MTQPPPAWVPPGYQSPSGGAHADGQPSADPSPYLRIAPPAPGCVPLRPLGVGDILDGAFRAVRRNPKVMLGVSGGFALVEALLGTALIALTFRTLRTVKAQGPTIDLSPVLANDTVQFAGFFVSALVGSVLTGLLTLVVTQDVLGTRLSAGEVWSLLRPRIWTVAGLSLVTSLLEFLGLLPFLVLGVWLWGIWAVAMPACVVERIGIRAALGRSKSLVDGVFWRVWGIRALGTLVVFVAYVMFSFPFTIFGLSELAGGLDSGNVSTLALVLTAVGTLIGRTLTAPVAAGIDALLYLDLRMRREGLDIAMQQAATRPRSPVTAG